MIDIYKKKINFKKFKLNFRNKKHITKVFIIIWEDFFFFWKKNHKNKKRKTKKKLITNERYTERNVEILSEFYL